jgi:putative peptide zinc metalloprotease protein
LTIREQQTANGTLFVVKDPASGAFFRLGPLEEFIVRQLDGATPLDAVRQRTEARFGSALPAATLAAFIQRLDKAGLLEGLEGKEPGQTGTLERRGRIRGSLLYLRFKLFDPDRLFDRLVHRVRLCFTPQFLVLSAAVILLAVGTALAHWAEIPRNVTKLTQVSAIPLLLAISFTVASAHEFGHGLTCKRFGGEVHELGFLLIYFTPALYTNVSDAWLFPEKSKRLWVGFAGPYFELFLWALATLVWRVTDTDTGVNYAALVVMTISGLKTLFNFNPLVKLDGYYLLSDYLEIPNLRARSFRYVGNLIKRLFGAPPIDAEISRRERLAYLAYGLVGATGSLALLGFVVQMAGGYLIEKQGPMALVVATGLMGMKSHRKFRRLFGGSPNRTDLSEDGDDVAVQPLESPQPAPSPAQPGQAQGTTKPNRKRVVWAVVAGVTLALLFLLRTQLRIAGPINVLPGANADVRTAVDGIVEEVNVHEGDAVEPGQVIARLSDRDLRSQLRQTQAELRGVRANLNKGLPPGEGEAARAAVDRLEAQQRYLEEGLQRVNIVSPVSGVVATPSLQLKALKGQLVARGALIAQVYDFSTITAQIVISEKDMADIRVGQNVVLKARAYPGVAFSGTVTAIGTSADGTVSAVGGLGAPAPGVIYAAGYTIPNRMFIVTTRIDNPGRLLRPGMTGWAKIYCGPRRIVELITRRLARTVRVEFWSWW